MLFLEEGLPPTGQFGWHKSGTPINLTQIAPMVALRGTLLIVLVYAFPVKPITENAAVYIINYYY